MNALIVGPSLFHRRTFANMLTPLGYDEVIETTSLPEAHEYMVEGQPDLVALEWSPASSAERLVAWMRSEVRFKRTPIIAISDEAYTGTVISAFKAGVNEYIVRPYTLEVVKERIEALNAAAYTAPAC